ncbi:MAG: hypothetical protein RL757_3051 [Bacteroidota bacterium]|jgi:predicted Zn-dependent peptidase
MIEFEKFELTNGLSVVLHSDPSTPLVAVNVLYNVGSRDEEAGRTGFAHLFEHLMFGGSKHAKKFDEVVQGAGGESNAFTNYDFTNYYITLPAQNLETALWLESDRMKNLAINKKSLSTQQKVVVEEFKETTLDEPYGDVWHHLNPMIWKNHPYKTPIIGEVPEHIGAANLDDVKNFYKKHYCPNNAILTIAGNIDMKATQALIEKWFGDIPKGDTPPRQLQAETPPNGQLRKTLTANVPVETIFMAFRAPGRGEADYAASDLLTDILSSGSSSRFYRKLLKEQRLFTEIDCYVMGLLDPSAIIVEGKPSEGVSLEAAEAAIWEELSRICETLVPMEELQKHKNRCESQQAFSAINAMHKAINLSFYELLGDANRVNTEVENYLRITPEDLSRVAKDIFRPENSCVLTYLPKKEKETA